MIEWLQLYPIIFGGILLVVFSVAVFLYKIFRRRLRRKALLKLEYIMGGRVSSGATECCAGLVSSILEGGGTSSGFDQGLRQE